MTIKTEFQFALSATDSGFVVVVGEQGDDAGRHDTFEAAERHAHELCLAGRDLVEIWRAADFDDEDAGSGPLARVSDEEDIDPREPVEE